MQGIELGKSEPTPEDSVKPEKRVGEGESGRVLVIIQRVAEGCEKLVWENEIVPALPVKQKLNSDCAY